jgi:hypothetical protein
MRHEQDIATGKSAVQRGRNAGIQDSLLSAERK